MLSPAKGDASLFRFEPCGEDKQRRQPPTGGKQLRKQCAEINHRKAPRYPTPVRLCASMQWQSITLIWKKQSCQKKASGAAI